MIGIADEVTRHQIAVWMAVGWVCVWVGYIVQLIIHLRQEAKDEKKQLELTSSYNHHTR